MYQTTIVPFGRYTRFEIFNPDTGNRFSVVPEKGANLLNLYFGDVNILDGYHTPEELETAKFGKSALLFPFPNRLDRGIYHWEGKQYRFPLNNAATENAIHGFVREEAFEVVKAETGQDYGSLHLRYAYEGERNYYPFPFTLDLIFTIRNPGKFTLRATCVNRHDRHIPFGFGWHPYFRLAEKAGEHFLKLPDCARVETNERMIPTGIKTAYPDFNRPARVDDIFLDNCFVALESGNYKLQLKADGHTLSVSADTRHFPFFQIFTPPHRSSIALEPMTCNVDALNNGDGLIVLEPKKKWQAAMMIQYKQNF